MKTAKIIILTEPGCGKTTIGKIIFDALREKGLKNVSYTDIDLGAEELSKFTDEEIKNNVVTLNDKITIQIEQQQAARGEMQ